MNKMLLLAGVAALFATNANALEVNPYVSAKLRHVDMSSSLKDIDGKVKLDDNVFGGSVAFGISTKVNGGAIRAELEYNKNEDTEKTLYRFFNAKVETNSTMLNGYYDIDTGSKFTPYIGAGMGYANVKGSVRIFGAHIGSMSDTNFAWQVGAGVGYAITNNVSFDVGYRYADYGNSKEDGSKLETTAHELYIGARYTF